MSFSTNSLEFFHSHQSPMIFKKMKLAPSFYCHVLTVARDGLITTFSTECVMSSGIFTVSPFFLNPLLSPQTFWFLLPWFMYFCVWVCVSISLYSIRSSNYRRCGCLSDLGFFLLPTVHNPFSPLFWWQTMGGFMMTSHSRFLHCHPVLVFFSASAKVFFLPVSAQAGLELAMDLW